MKDPQQVWQTLKNFDYPIFIKKAADFFTNLLLFLISKMFSHLKPSDLSLHQLLLYYQIFLL